MHTKTSVMVTGSVLGTEYGVDADGVTKAGEPVDRLLGTGEVEKRLGVDDLKDRHVITVKLGDGEGVIEAVAGLDEQGQTCLVLVISGVKSVQIEDFR